MRKPKSDLKNVSTNTKFHRIFFIEFPYRGWFIFGLDISGQKVMQCSAKCRKHAKLVQFWCIIHHQKNVVAKLNKVQQTCEVVAKLNKLQQTCRVGAKLVQNSVHLQSWCKIDQHSANMQTSCKTYQNLANMHDSCKTKNLTIGKFENIKTCN